MALTRRRYTWEYRPAVGPTAKRLGAQVRKILDEFCEDWPQFYSDPIVEGWDLGLVRFSIIVYSRDQWWVGRRAIRVLSAVRAYTNIPIMDVTVVDVDRLPPHEHRGKTWLAEHRSPSSS